MQLGGIKKLVPLRVHYQNSRRLKTMIRIFKEEVAPLFAISLFLAMLFAWAQILGVVL